MNLQIVLLVIAILVSYTLLQSTFAQLCPGCIGGSKLRQLGQDLQNNPSIPQSVRDEVASRLNAKAAQLEPPAPQGCTPLDPRC